MVVLYIIYRNLVWVRVSTIGVMWMISTGWCHLHHHPTGLYCRSNEEKHGMIHDYNFVICRTFYACALLRVWLACACGCVPKMPSKMSQATTPWRFCSVCRRHHDQGRNHIFTTKHKSKLNMILSKFAEKVRISAHQQSHVRYTLPCMIHEQ